MTKTVTNEPKALDEEYFDYLIRLLTIASIPLNNQDHRDYHKVIVHLQRRKMNLK